MAAENIELKQYHDKINFLHIFQAVLLYFNVIFTFVTTGELSSFILSIIFLSLFFYFSFQVLEQLFYTYWTFTFFLFVYVTINLVASEGDFLPYSYALVLILILIEAYTLSSPLYYPRSMWWEYDFRYRNEIRISAQIGEKEVEGRLTDLRREAGCVQLFQNIDLGKVIEITPRDRGSDHSMNVQIVSKRIYSIGRPYTYGVKFLLRDKKEKEEFNVFKNLWKRESRRKRKKKFEKV